MKTFAIVGHIVVITLALLMIMVAETTFLRLIFAVAVFGSCSEVVHLAFPDEIYTAGEDDE